MPKFIIILLPMRLIYTIVNLEDKATSASLLRKFWRSHRSQKTLLGSEGNRGIFLGIDIVFCKFYKISSLEQNKPSKLLILGPLKFDLEIGKKYLDAKTCFIDSLMIILLIVPKSFPYAAMIHLAIQILNPNISGRHKSSLEYNAKVTKI